MSDEQGSEPVGNDALLRRLFRDDGQDAPVGAITDAAFIRGVMSRVRRANRRRLLLAVVPGAGIAALTMLVLAPTLQALPAVLAQAVIGAAEAIPQWSAFDGGLVVLLAVVVALVVPTLVDRLARSAM